MNFGLNRPFSIPFWVIVAASMAAAHPDLSVILEKFAIRLRENPADYQARAERAWLQLEHEQSGGTVGEDIDILLSRPDWRAKGLRFRAYHLFRLGRMEEAKALIVKNIRSEASDGPEQPRLLAQIELAAKDTGAAIEALRRGWMKRREESDLIELLALFRARKQVPEKILKEGLNRHPRSPGVVEGVFDTHWAAGGRAGLKRCLEISTQAISWWPRSVDWKIRHARVLLGQGKPKQAEPFLMAALDLVDDSSRLDPNAKAALDIRKEVFALLEAAK